MAHTDKRRQQHSSSFKGHYVTCWRTDFSSNFEEVIEEGAFTSLLISAEMLIRVLQQNNKK